MLSSWRLASRPCVRTSCPEHHARDHCGAGTEIAYRYSIPWLEVMQLQASTCVRLRAVLSLADPSAYVQNDDSETMDKIRVAVIGAGVVGLSTAVCVAESVPGCSVTVVAEKFSPQTTSDVAAGVLSPHFSPETPVHRQKRWFEDTFAHVYSIAQTAEAPNIGVQILSGWEIFQEPPVEHIPFWADSVLAFRVMNDAELKRFPQAIFGWMYTTLLCDCTHYLPWLEKR
ncbi:hypothetical protein scyTo_0018680 [Scyliorhinus torazame]|uniref:D-aspartate oxidase n=1 Tax=Scyliorhinus torazame TaxID=75743 RepID=A0A401Q0V1_SCYTO|nr:hypothetical protein [Scyliorhinus torazame]